MRTNNINLPDLLETEIFGLMEEIKAQKKILTEINKQLKTQRENNVCLAFQMFRDHITDMSKIEKKYSVIEYFVNINSIATKTLKTCSTT